MKNRHSILFLLAIVSIVMVIVSSCKDKTGVTIKGTISGIEKKATIYLLQQEFDRVLPVDSAVLSPQKESFRFKIKSIKEPTFYQLKVKSGKGSTLVLLADFGESIELEIDINNISNYKVSGSQGSEKTKLLNDRLSETKVKLDSLAELIKSTRNELVKEGLSQSYEAVIDEQRNFSSTFILENPLSRASVMAAYQQVEPNRFVFDRSEDLKLLKIVATTLQVYYPESGYTKGMLADIKRQEQRLTNYAIRKMVEEAEPSLPEISLPNPEGDTVKLSSLRGKVILLDFWASFNQASLLENQEYKNIYDLYHPKGLEIFQVSMDTKREDWVNQIQLTRLPWINVSELNPTGSYVARVYNVTKIPANYLIDRDFNIVAKNIYGKELERKIKEII
ncbi:MAG TPA: TlpA disulfide reductase family protein [Tenuifilaceae bacterium]|nr:TlpA disulfide reductase family protein [Tenuifilaceae bacterium]